MRVDDANSALRVVGARVSGFGAVSERRKGDAVAWGRAMDARCREIEMNGVLQLCLLSCVANDLSSYLTRKLEGNCDT